MIESFNGKLRDELLNREGFTTLEEAAIQTVGNPTELELGDCT